MITQEDVNSYVIGALNYPVRDEKQLIAMVVLHFDIPYEDAERMVKERMRNCKIDPYFNLYK